MHLVSPKEIFNNVGIVDTDKYRELVESLNEIGILNRVVSNPKAQSLAKKRKVSKKSVGRYKIVLPNSDKKVIKKIQEKDESDYAKIFVGGLDWHAKEDDIESKLSKYGDISEIVIPKNRFTGKSRGFAFVEFESQESAKKAINSEDKLFINEKKIYIQKFRK